MFYLIFLYEQLYFDRLDSQTSVHLHFCQQIINQFVLRTAWKFFFQVSHGKTSNMVFKDVQNFDRITLRYIVPEDNMNAFCNVLHLLF